MLKFYEGGGKIFSFNLETREFIELKEIGQSPYAGGDRIIDAVVPKKTVGRIKRSWTRVTPEMIAEIQTLKNKGIKSKVVAKMLKISHGAVNRNWTPKEKLPPEDNI